MESLALMMTATVSLMIFTVMIGWIWMETRRPKMEMLTERMSQELPRRRATTDSVSAVSLETAA